MQSAVATPSERVTTKPLRTGARFCTQFLLLSGLGFVLPLLWGHTAAYSEHTDVLDHALLRFPFDLKNATYDFVIFGDSSGLFGLDPLIIGQDLGRSVLNLCTTRNVLIMNGTTGLDAYLSHNKRPKVIVLAINAADDDPAGLGESSFTYEATLNTLQHGPFRSFLRILIHPAALVSLWSKIITYSARMSFTDSPAWRRSVQQGSGHVPFPGERHPETCDGTQHPHAPMTHKFIKWFVGRYKAEHIPVLVYILPTSDCNPYFVEYKAAFAGIAANTPYQIDHRKFQNDGLDHPFPEMVPAISNALAETIRQRLPEYCGHR